MEVTERRNKPKVQGQPMAFLRPGLSMVSPSLFLRGHRVRPQLCSSRMGAHRPIPRVGKTQNTWQILAFHFSVVFFQNVDMCL